ncbi:MAG TPA: alpha-L-fucosidase [Bryobacteraceae bacterium]
MEKYFSRRDFLKRTSIAGAGAALLSNGAGAAFGKTPPFPGKFQESADSLSLYNVPTWYRDAKFGIFIHWGVFSVPAHKSEWYPHDMYDRKSPVFDWHRQHWGPQSMFGYKDFIPLFRAEKWQPAEWVNLFKTAGAKYIVPVGEHHDGFPMYDSHLTRWTARRMGPHRDVVGELAREIRNENLKLGISSHRGNNWFYFTFEPDFDDSNPRYSGLYGKDHPPKQPASQGFLQDWYSRCVEIVDLYRPDLVYFDWKMNDPEFKPYRMQWLAYYYNMADHWGQEVVCNYKYKAYPAHAAVLDIERGLENKIRELPWQTDTSVSWKSWGYIEDDSYKSASEIIPEFVDIVSKNGNLLLNVGPKADGTIPEPAVKLFHEIGQWMDMNGEAIYGSRPWKVFGEGPTSIASGSFGEKHAKGLQYKPSDIRFTTKNGAIYAIMLAWPEKQARIQAMGKNAKNLQQQISNVELLGHEGKLTWHQEADALVIDVPGNKPGDYAYTFKVIV